MEKEKKKTLKKTTKSFTISLLDPNGKPAGTFDLGDVVHEVTGKQTLLAQYVRVYLNNQRQGNASTKTRGEVIGSTKKIYRQKGTGKARHGDIKAPVFVGGGVVGGPKPRDFTLKMNKKQRRKALFYALSLKYKEKSIMGMSEAFIDLKPKTKSMDLFFRSAGVGNGKVLVVVSQADDSNVVLASRNIPYVSLIDVHLLNPYLVVANSKVIFSSKALPKMKDYFLAKKDEN